MFQDLYNTADTPAFQHMSYVAAWVVGQDILGLPLGAPPGGTTQERQDWAGKVMREELKITPRQLAFQMLRNDIVAAGVNSTDQQMVTACLERLDNLVAAG